MSYDKGIYYAVITPFTEDERVDRGTLEELLTFGLDRGVHGVFALGSAGQGPVMSNEERKRAAETIVDTIDGQVPLILHIGTADTESSVDLAKHAERAGADMIASLPPHYYTSGGNGTWAHDHYEIVSHFERIAESTDLDLVLYNNPGYTGFDMTPELVERYADEVPAIAGIKSGRTPPADVVEYQERTSEEFMTFAGLDYLFPTVYHGVHGTVNPPTGPFPELAVDYWNAIVDRDVNTVVELQATLRELSTVLARYARKYGRGIYVPLFELRGIRIDRYPKWRTRPIEAGDKEALYEDLTRIGLDEYCSL